MGKRKIRGKLEEKQGGREEEGRWEKEKRGRGEKLGESEEEGRKNLQGTTFICVRATLPLRHALFAPRPFAPRPFAPRSLCVAAPFASPPR